jgi:hypothetical protein
MLTFLISLALMFTLVWSGITWAKREDRRRMAADELNGIEEVHSSARHHQ